MLYLQSCIVILQEMYMKNADYNIDENALFCVTGDPFADAGGYALKELMTQFPDKGILGLIMLATHIYVDEWDAKINPYFLNSKITQPAFDAEKKKSETRSYFEGMLNGALPSRKGYCRITGRYADLYPAGRDNTVLSGSGKFVNFHHTFAPGMMLSKEVLIRYHFLPLASEYVLDKISVISSSSASVAELYARRCCARILSDVGENQSSGILRSHSRSTGTAIFRFLDDLFTKYRDDGKGHSITMYHFTNFGASPDVQIYTLPSKVFLFYRVCCNAVYREEWNDFVARYYKTGDYKNISFDVSSGSYVASNIYIKENEYQYWRNVVYDNLLSGISILRMILQYSRKSVFDLNLLKNYLINIRNMKKETVEKIYQIADFIMQAYDESDMKNIIRSLDGVKNSYLLRRFLLHNVITKNYSQGNDMIVSVEDYVDYLFPDTSSWIEVRDVLLIAIYQRLHERHTEIEVDVIEDDGFGDDVK